MGKEIYIIGAILAVSLISFSLFSNEVFAQLTVQAIVSWDKESYKICDTGIVTVNDENLNVESGLIDLGFVRITSDSDPVGVEIIILESVFIFAHAVSQVMSFCNHQALCHGRSCLITKRDFDKLLKCIDLLQP